MRSTIATIINLFLLCSIPAYGQEPRLKLEVLDKLAAQATETVDINVDGEILKLVPLGVFGGKPSSAAKIKELIDGIKGVYLRKFEFDKEGSYTAEDVEAIRSQLRPPAWTKVVGVRAGRGRQNVEGYIRSEGNTVTGVAVISAEPRELIVANVVGIIDIDKLAELFREFDLPWLDWTRPGKTDKE